MLGGRCPLVSLVIWRKKEKQGVPPTSHFLNLSLSPQLECEYLKERGFAVMILYFLCLVSGRVLVTLAKLLLVVKLPEEEGHDTRKTLIPKEIGVCELTSLGF